MREKLTEAMKGFNWRKLVPSRVNLGSSKRGKPAGRIAVAYWDRENVSYLVTLHKASRTIVQEWGNISHLDCPHPLAALAEHFKEQQIDTNHLLVLLSRTEVDVLTLSLPPSDASELPSLVFSEVEQQLGESEVSPITDFYSLPLEPVNQGGDEEASEEPPWQKVLAFSLSENKLDQMQQQAAQAGLRLSGVGFRQLSALNQLQRLESLEENSLNISLQVYLGEVELAILAGQSPLILRSVRVNLEDIGRVAEQLIVEVERCTTLLPPEYENLPRRWIVDTCNSFAGQLSQAIADRLDNSIQIIETSHSAKRGQLAEAYRINLRGNSTEPGSEQLEDSRSDELAESPDSPQRSTSAPPGLSIALGGAVLDYLDNGFPIDFIAPKRPPAPPNPWVKPGIWAAGGATAASIVGLMLMMDVWQLQDEVNDLELRLAEAKKFQLKSQEKADQVQMVEQWLSDQVDWLTALSEVSQRLPDGKNATVRRLTASTNGSEGIFDLSVQVRQPDDISVLESRLRSVKYSVTSKRISQAPEASEYPWRFETRISFPIEPIAWNRFGPPGSDLQPQSASTAEIDELSSSSIATQERIQ